MSASADTAAGTSTPDPADLFAGRFLLRGGARDGRLHAVLPARLVTTNTSVELWLPHESLVPTPEVRARWLSAAWAQRGQTPRGLLPLVDAFDDERPCLVVPAARRPVIPFDVLDTRAGLPLAALTLARRLAPVLDAAHERGQVHGFLTAGDVWSHQGSLVLAGVGLWSSFDREALIERLGAGAPLAPEVRAGHDPMPAADVWGLASLCLRMCVGSGGSALDALAHAYPRVNAALAPALSWHASERPASCGAFLAELETAVAKQRVARGTAPPAPGSGPNPRPPSAPGALAAGTPRPSVHEAPTRVAEAPSRPNRRTPPPPPSSSSKS